MSARYRVAVVVGSNRRESVNRKLANAAIRLAPKSLDFLGVRIDDLPMYCEDLEGERPASVARVVDALRSADAVFIVSPEYNRSVPAVLKNAIDWASRPIAANVWRDKLILLAGASPGPLGTAMGQHHLRQVLAALGSLLLGGELLVRVQPGLFDAADNLIDEKTRTLFEDRWQQIEALTAARTVLR